MYQTGSLWGNLKKAGLPTNLLSGNSCINTAAPTNVTNASNVGGFSLITIAGLALAGWWIYKKRII